MADHKTPSSPTGMNPSQRAKHMAMFPLLPAIYHRSAADHVPVLSRPSRIRVHSSLFCSRFHLYLSTNTTISVFHPLREHRD